MYLCQNRLESLKQYSQIKINKCEKETYTYDNFTSNDIYCMAKAKLLIIISIIITLPKIESAS